MAMSVNKPKFITHLQYEEIPDSKIIRLTAPFCYYSPTISRLITVPAGFECDRESIPRIPFVYWMLGNSSAEAGVLHDYLYRVDSEPIVSRAIADDIYYEASCLDGNYRAQAWFKWAGVRIGGASSYHKRKVMDKL